MDGVITREVIAEKLDQIAEKIDKIDTILTGNGDPSKGLIVRMDRLEQVESRRKWQIRTLAASFAGGAISWIWKQM